MRSRWRDPVPRNGVDGRDADPAELERAVKEQVALIPKPADGKDADPGEITRQIAQAVRNITVPVGKDGLRGPEGPQGPAGPIGPKPRHEWKETELRFEKSDGSWGKYVDLRGPPGFGGGGGTAYVENPFDIDSLPIGDTSTPEEIVVKQHGIWVRIPWDTFVDLVGVPTVTLDLSLDDDLLSLDDDQLGVS